MTALEERVQQAPAEPVVTASRLARWPLLIPLRGRDFRLVWFGEGISLLGDQFYFVALTWLTLQLTGSGLALGTLLMVAAIPRGVFMLVGGALTDRLSARTLMLVSHIVRAVIVAAIASLVALHAVQLWHLYVLAISFGVIDAFFFPASAAIVPSLVDEAALAAGNALMRGTMQITLLIGPGLAGLLIATAGSSAGNGAAFGIDAASFAIAAVMLLRTSPHPQTNRSDGPVEGTSEDPGGMVSAIRDGIRYAWHDPIIRPLLVAIAAIDFCFAGPLEVGLASLAHGKFAAGAVGFGTMLAGWGGGAMVGTIVGGSMGQPRRRGRILIPLVGLLGLGLASLGVVPSATLATVLTASMGFASGLTNTLLLPWLQTRTDARMLGRVMSLVMLASLGLSPVSLAVSGVLADVNIVVLFVAAGAIVMLATAVMVTNKQLRGID